MFRKLAIAGGAPGGALMVQLICRAVAEDVAVSEVVVYEAVVRPGQVPDDAVNCGGHWAEDCEVCPNNINNGNVQMPHWCNGDCSWQLTKCVPRDEFTPVTTTADHILYHLQWYLWMILAVVIASILFCYAAVYKNKVVDEYPDYIDVAPFDFDNWIEREYGLMDVFRDAPTLLWACWCTPVLAAKNYHVGKVMPFWPSCLAIGCTMYSPLCFLAPLIRAIFSVPLQRNLRHDTSFISEFAIGLCCFCCAVGRDSLEVDEESALSVRCPFEVERSFFQEVFEGSLEKDRACCARNCSVCGSARNCHGGCGSARNCCGGSPATDNKSRSCFRGRGCCGPSEHDQRGDNGRSCFSAPHCSGKDRACCPSLHVPNMGIQCMCGDGSCVCGRGGRTRVCGPSED